MTLQLDHVKKHYKSFSLDCSMELLPGRITGLIGKNGAGKSTTFKAILGLIKTDGGTITYNEKKINDLSIKDKEQIGVVLSESGFSGYLMVKDLLPILSAFYPTFDAQAFTEKCSHFSIPMNKQIKEFSTGMKAKLKTLVAMSHDSQILILDEPTSGLDVIAREEIIDMLHDFMEDETKSILISSHISSDLESLCDDIYLIDNGKILLHEETYVLLDDYGIIKLSEEQYNQLDKSYLLYTKQESYGYRCLTDQKQFYLENYPNLSIEKNSIDEVLSIIISGQEVKK